jgi:hypothetical protein
MQDLHRQFLAYLLTYPQGFAQLLSEKGACVTVMPSCCLIHAMYYVELATNVATPYPAAPDSPPKGKRLTTFCASLSLLQNVFAVHPRESVSLGSQVALLSYEPSSLATLFRGGENKPLYAFL